MFVNRIFKFRGQDISGVWHFGDLIHYRNCVTISEYKNGLWGNHEVISNTVGQFTGLYDGVEGEDSRNEIYEDDICTVTETFTNNNGEKHTEVYIMLVRYKNYKFEFYSQTTNPRDLQYINDFCTVNVIGNIHDNKELLENGNA